MRCLRFTGELFFYVHLVPILPFVCLHVSFCVLSPFIPLSAQSSFFVWPPIGLSVCFSIDLYVYLLVLVSVRPLIFVSVHPVDLWVCLPVGLCVW